jgi:uncharacterized protein
MKTAEYWIDALKLQAHPEGGFFREIYRSSVVVEGTNLPVNEPRNLSTSIYYLLRSSDVSHFHRLRSDELWYYHYGSTIRIHQISSNGILSFVDLGAKPDNGEALQANIPAGTIFGAEVLDEKSYSLIGCVVSPGFDFKDFELMKRQNLLEAYPEYKEIILRFTM